MNNNMAVVAMSGGVDSTLAACYMQEEGWEVVGVSMRMFEEDYHFREKRKRVARIVFDLGIEHHWLDVRSVFKSKVIDYFLKAYQNGLTPNPCVVCNQEIKFGHLLRWVNKNYPEAMLATGHYACVLCGEACHLKGAEADKKDQSYFLYTLTPDILAQVLFPLGGVKSKNEVKKKVDSLGIKVEQESQDICFLRQNRSYRDLLKKEGIKGEGGEIKNKEGEVLGTHQGVYNFTVGQREGIGIPSTEPYYVLEILPEKNEITVGRKKDLETTFCYIEKVNYIQPYLKNLTSFDAECRVRYQGNKVSCQVVKEGEQTLVVFAEAVQVVTPGQSLVFYCGKEILGGGVIKKKKDQINF